MISWKDVVVFEDSVNGAPPVKVGSLGDMVKNEDPRFLSSHFDNKRGVYRWIGHTMLLPDNVMATVPSEVIEQTGIDRFIDWSGFDEAIFA
jgi:hypothetical protein